MIKGPANTMVGASLSFSDNTVNVVPALALAKKYDHDTLLNVANLLYTDHSNGKKTDGYQKGATLLQKFMDDFLMSEAIGPGDDSPLSGFWMRFGRDGSHTYDIRFEASYRLNDSTCQLFPWTVFTKRFFTEKEKGYEAGKEYEALSPKRAGKRYGDYLFEELLAPETSCVAADSDEPAKQIKQLVDALFVNEAQLHDRLHEAAKTLAYSMGYHGKDKIHEMFLATFEQLKQRTHDINMVRHVFFGIYFEKDHSKDGRGVKVMTAKYDSIVDPLVETIKVVRAPGTNGRAQKLYDDAIANILENEGKHITEMAYNLEGHLIEKIEEEINKKFHAMGEEDLIQDEKENIVTRLVQTIGKKLPEAGAECAVQVFMPTFAIGSTIMLSANDEENEKEGVREAISEALKLKHPTLLKQLRKFENNKTCRVKATSDADSQLWLQPLLSGLIYRLKVAAEVEQAVEGALDKNAVQYEKDNSESNEAWTAHSRVRASYPLDSLIDIIADGTSKRCRLDEGELNKGTSAVSKLNQYMRLAQEKIKNASEADANACRQISADIMMLEVSLVRKRNGVISWEPTLFEKIANTWSVSDGFKESLEKAYKERFEGSANTDSANNENKNDNAKKGQKRTAPGATSGKDKKNGNPGNDKENAKPQNDKKTGKSANDKKAQKAGNKKKK